MDVIVPVYGGFQETRACLESIWANPQITPFRLVVINDASPDPEITTWLREAATYRPMLLLENENNVGFAATVNRGMALSETGDVVLLNSDTEVTGNWLDRLRSAAYKDARVGTVTPFTNNGTICSYPRFCEDNALPQGYDLARLDAHFAAVNAGAIVNIPTAVGFCMFIRRDCLSDTNLFDHKTFGAGYGEENDFCLRATKKGWKHILACDVFVWHKGNVSFGSSHNIKKREAHGALLQLHKGYEVVVQRFILADPAREYRARVDMARLENDLRPRILIISHNRGGGTEKHIRELADYLKDRAQFLIIRPEAGGQVCLEWLDPAEGLRFWFALPADYVALCNTIRLLGVSRVHIHHTLGLPPQVFGILDDLHLPWDFTAHDYYPCCPQITLTRHDNRYCGEPDDVGCNHCLKDNPAPGRVDITAWRDSHRFLIDRAERVFAPSGDVAQRYKRYFPAGHYIVANHPDMEGLEPPAVRRLAPIANRSLRIAVIGALSPMKGADLLEAAAVDAQVRNLPLRFCLFGYAYRHLRAKHTLEVRGPYEDRDLPTLLRRWQPDLVWFPAQWPETYSYTLSACLVLGLPVVATDLGAIAERLTGRPYSWILPWQTSADEWNEFFVAVARGSRPNDAAVRHGNLQVSTFSYADNYINHIPSSIRIASAAALVPVAWREHLRPRVEGRRRRLKVRIGRALVVVLARLRGYPWTARLARRIPVQVQRSIKNRLLGNEPKNRS